MSTTEVVVEQLIIGTMVMAVLVVLVPPDVTTLMYHSGIERLPVLLVAAYLLGVIYDRVSDTLMQDLEQRLRLFAALRWAATPPALEGDPYPEARYRALSLGSETATGYASYLRSRIRLTRAATTLVPALVIAAGAVRWGELGDRLIIDTPLVVPLALYPAAFLTKLVRPLSSAAQHPVESVWTRLGWMLRGPEVPWTDSLVEPEARGRYAATMGWVDGASRSFTLAVLTRERLTIALAACSYWQAALGWRAFGWHGLWWGAAILPLTLLVGWTWWRISWTYMAFLRDWARFAPKKEA